MTNIINLNFFKLNFLKREKFYVFKTLNTYNCECLTKCNLKECNKYVIIPHNTSFCIIEEIIDNLNIYLDKFSCGYTFEHIDKKLVKNLIKKGDNIFDINTENNILKYEKEFEFYDFYPELKIYNLEFVKKYPKNYKL